MCPACGGRLGLKLARTGGFIGCSNYPTCRHARALGVAGDADGDYAADMAGSAQAMGSIQQCQCHLVPAFVQVQQGGAKP